MRVAILTAAAVLVPVALQAQSADETIQRALAGAPANAREGAMVVRWNADHTYEVLKEGSNTWVCYDRSGEGGRPAFAVQCTSAANLDRIAQNRRFAAEAADRQALRAMVAEAEANGTRVPAEYGSMWLATNGPDMANASTHVTIAVPGATGATTGLPESRDAGGAFLMAGGTSEAHIMVPIPH
ncbi:MAG: hypothetical protein R3195_07855 [Gemmatimonadota bacterium]|nr:hypothetical protein [Gemmatimonadota bacterium]